MNYQEMNFKIPVECEDYLDCSDFVINAVKNIIKASIEKGENKIFVSPEGWVLLDHLNIMKN